MKNQKGFSTVVGIIIVIAVVVIAFGGVFAYEHFATKIQPIIPVQQNQAQNTTSTTQPSITITSPAVGEQWQLGTTHLITWQAVGFHSQTRVWLSVYDYSQHPNGYPNKQYPVNFSPTAGNMSLPVYSGSYSWTIPLNFATSSKMKIEISSNPIDDSILNENISQESNYFSIITPTINQTAGWQTYTNTQYDFSINYFQNLNNPQLEKAPVLCTMENGTPTPIGCVTLRPDQMKYLSLYVADFFSKNKSEYNLMRISVLDNKNLLSLNDWYDDYSKTMFATIDPTPPNQRIAMNVGGVNGFMMNEGCCDNIDFNAYIPDGDKIIIINLNGNIMDNKAEKIKEDLSQMLSTFKFIK